MKSKYFKINIELIGLQVFFSVLSFIFSFFFSWMDNWEWIFSFFTGWLFLGAVHSTLRQLGDKDRKNIAIANNHLKDGEKMHKIDYLKGAKIGSVFFGVNFLIVLLTLFFESAPGFGDCLYIVHRVMLGALMGFLPTVESVSYWLVAFLLCFVMYLPCITAYISGAKDFSLTEKIVPKIIYKSK